MTGFLYFLPNRQTEQVGNVQRARDVGLGHAFELDEQVAKARCLTGGPGGSAGLFVYDPHQVPPNRVGHDPTRQTWRQTTPLSPGAGSPPAYWIGYWTDEPPDLDAYRRREYVDGSPVSLENGGSILCPTAKQYELDEDTPRVVWDLALPRVLDINLDGETILGDVNARHRTLWRLAEQYDAAVAAAIARAAEEETDEVRFEFPQMNELVDVILRTNYRFGLQELLTLGLFTTQFRRRVVDVLLDADSLVALQKKMLDLLAARGSTDSCNGPIASKADDGTDSAIVPPLPIGEHLPPEAITTTP